MFLSIRETEQVTRPLFSLTPSTSSQFTNVFSFSSVFSSPLLLGHSMLSSSLPLGHSVLSCSSPLGHSRWESSFDKQSKVRYPRDLCYDKVPIYLHSSLPVGRANELQPTNILPPPYTRQLPYVRDLFGFMVTRDG